MHWAAMDFHLRLNLILNGQEGLNIIPGTGITLSLSSKDSKE